MEKLFHLLTLALFTVSTITPVEQSIETTQVKEIVSSAGKSIEDNEQQRRDDVILLKNSLLSLVGKFRQTLSALIKNENDGKHPNTVFQKLSRIKNKQTKATSNEIIFFLTELNVQLEKAHALLQDVNNLDNALDKQEELVAHAHDIITRMIKQLRYAIKYRFSKETLKFVEISQKTIPLFCIEKTGQEFQVNSNYLDNLAQQITQLTLTEVNHVSRKVGEIVSPYVPSKTNVALTTVSGLALYCAYEKYYNGNDWNSVLKTEDIKNLYNNSIEKYIPNSQKSLMTFLALCDIPVKISTGIAALIAGKTFLTQKTQQIKNYLANKLLGSTQLKHHDYKHPWISYPTTTFNDVFGMKKEKNTLEELIDYLINPEYATSIGAVPAHLSYIFAGKTRAGKTHLVKAFVGTLNELRKQDGLKTYPLISIKVSDYISEGGFKGRVKLIHFIQDIREWFGSCIVFIDEVDLLNLQRDKNNKLLSEFLDGLDQSTQDPKNPVILFTATNRVDKLDEALKQPGRFGKVIHFAYPTKQERKLFIEKLLKDNLINTNNIDLDLWAQRMHKTAFETIKMLIDEAKRLARTRNTAFDNNLLEYAYLKVVKGVDLHKEQIISQEDEITRSAYFAGQALASTLLDTHKQINFVTTLSCEVLQKETQSNSVGARTAQAVTRNGKLFTMPSGDTKGCLSIAQEINQIKVLLAGAAAQEIMTNQPACTRWNTEDNKKIFKLCCNLTFDGLEYKKDLPEQIRTQMTKQALALKADLFVEIKELLKQHKDDLVKLNIALCQSKTLTAAQVQEVLQ